MLRSSEHVDCRQSWRTRATATVMVTVHIAVLLLVGESYEVGNSWTLNRFEDGDRHRNRD